MLLLLIALFLIVPLLEVALFILVGSGIGVLPTLALCVLDAIAGALLVRHQGVATLTRLRDEIRRGRVPAMEIAEGAALFVSGALLITPGFFTDAIGLLLLIPPARRGIIRWLFRRFAKRIDVVFSPRDGGDNGPMTIDVEAEEITNETTGHANPRSPWRRGQPGPG